MKKYYKLNLFILFFNSSFIYRSSFSFNSLKLYANDSIQQLQLKYHIISNLNIKGIDNYYVKSSNS